MNKPIVTVKEKKYFVSSVSVVLKLNSGPLIYLRLAEKLDGTENKPSNEETFKQEFFADICSEAEGTFEWGESLKFFLVGYNSSEVRNFELVGLVVKKDLIDWFNQNNFKEKKEDYLIYQKGKGKISWLFFNKVLGDNFKQPSQDFVEKIQLLFPDNSCIWRYKESNNFHFLNRAMAFASRHLPQVQGWCSFDESSKPLRLIIFEEKKQDKTIPKLDNTWSSSSSPFVPNRYSWNRWLNKSSTLTRELSIQNGQEMALIKKLTSHGLSDEDGKSYQAQNPTLLLFSPGTITIGDKNIFCHTITYEFKLPASGEEKPPSVTMKIEVNYPERQIGDNEIISLRLSGKFKEWHQKKDGETEIKIVASDLKNWGIIDEGSQILKSGNDAVLYTHILSRTYSDKKYSGIYIKHEKDDEMIVDIKPYGIPLVLGSVQKYRKELEKADVTLSGQKLAISVSEHYQSLDNSEAIILDNSEIKLNHGKRIFGQAQQKVDFLSKNIELGSTQIEINSGRAKINSLLNVSFPSPKVPTPNVPSSPVASGLASGKIGGGTRASVVGLSGGGVPGNNKSGAVDSDYQSNDNTITTVDGFQFIRGRASEDNNLCLLDSLSQLLRRHTRNNNITRDFLSGFFQGANLMQVGPEQDFFDRNITEPIAAAYGIGVQAHIVNENGTITDAPVVGNNDGPILHVLHQTLGRDTHHFSPLFPVEQPSGGASGGEAGIGEASSSSSPSMTSKERVIKRKQDEIDNEIREIQKFIVSLQPQLIALQISSPKNENSIKAIEEMIRQKQNRIDELYEQRQEVTASPTEVFKEDPEDFLKNNILQPVNLLPHTSPGAQENNKELTYSGIKSFILEKVGESHYKLKVVNNDDGKYPNTIKAAYYPYQNGSPGENLENIGHVKLDDEVDFAFTGGMNGCALALTSNEDGSLEAWHFQSPEKHPDALEKFREREQLRLREWYNFGEYHKRDPDADPKLDAATDKGLFEANNFFYKKGNEWYILSQEIYYDYDVHGHQTNHRYSEPQIRRLGNQDDAIGRLFGNLEAGIEAKAEANRRREAEDNGE